MKPQKKKKNEQSTHLTLSLSTIKSLILLCLERQELKRGTLDLFTYENFIGNEILPKNFT